ncbi:ABC transporter ATP-binding protein [Protaetiibacter larvae]|uniref:Energy-coupling factor ABC transporter ATP-binding protein n=1 Tax=Protaetiibacter larvae TaxID=2592654 RepID=A0A5C1Y6L1_9MICO|nr:ABC transporter ATP-binding protein [Protaetiibacter larvae]QEO09426.1 energy-coupling factor ABC transporter ATP-binding protein [Protaetiibacter larvae]
MTAPAPLAVEDVRIRHDGRERWTPDGASFVLQPGEVLLLLGPSGSGKSTLALALNGLIPHAVPAELHGVVRVSGADTRTHQPGVLSAEVGMVFQDPDSQLVTGTLLDEVCFGPENLLVPVDEVLARAESALRRVGLWERRRESPDRLSGGGRQRLAIACALALAPRAIVLDEPTANLDPVGIEEVYAALAEIVAERETAIVLVEHNLDAAATLVDRVVVLDGDGRLVADGGVDEVLRGRAGQLHALGVWLPVATLAGMRLRAAGVRLEPLPLTPEELRGQLDALPALPALPAPPAVEPASADPVVRVRELAVERGGRAILHGIDLEVRRGEFLAIVGENGAGKTTLLQAIAGVLTPPRGRIEVAGLDPARADVRELARAIGFVFQNPEHQFIRHTVASELAHGLELQRLPEQEIAAQVDGMLARFGLADAREVHPFLLSGGQKRRLSVGTALIAGAPVLALDEPTFGQDRERAAELLDMLAALNAAGTTVLVVTHDMQLVAEYASHVAVLRDGALLVHDTTGAVLAGDALEQAGLRHPPLASAMRGLAAHPGWRGITRIDELPRERVGEVRTA